MNKVNMIPENVKNHLQLKLLSVFGEDFVSMKFAVRSSAIGSGYFKFSAFNINTQKIWVFYILFILYLGEDGDEMSAAGQNETFLGIVGFNNVNIALFIVMLLCCTNF